MQKQTRRKVIRGLMNAMLYIGLTALVAYLMPQRTVHFKYYFEQGRPWRYALLTAKEDFPIYKSEAALEQERAEVLAAYTPYYNISTTTAERQYAAIAASTEEKALQGKRGTYLEEKLREVYAKGVMSSQDMERLNSEGTTRVTTVNERRVGTLRHLEELYTPKTAYEYIVNAATSDTKAALRALELNRYLVPNLTYDESASNKARESLLATVSLTEGVVQAGERIVDKGDIVGERTYQILNSLRLAYEERGVSALNRVLSVLGNILLISIFIGMLVLYLSLFRPEWMAGVKNNLFFCLLVGLLAISAWVVLHYLEWSVYIVPMAWIPVLVRVFYDSRTGFFVHLTATLLLSIIVSAPLEFVVLQTVVGLVVVSSLRDVTQRSQLARTSVFIFLAYSVSYTVFMLSATGDWMTIDPWRYLCFAINAVLVLLAYGLIYICERMFGFVSATTLVELTDVNSNLMLAFAERAPGTFQHSLQVSNLATEASKKIGANTLLVRAGALYHDIGKLACPENFTENQSGGVNPLLQMRETEAAQVVIGHVTQGVRMAKEHRLPAIIVHFIESHHGTSKVRYFYNNYVNTHPDEPVDEALFTYPGPKPSSKEAVILMMADAVEARSRSLQEYTEESISQMVEQMVSAQIADGQFSEARLTFRDVEMIKAVFKEKLIRMNHHRIAYPELQKK